MRGGDQLPVGWTWASLEELLISIETGKSFKCEERRPKPDEVGVVKVSAVSWGEYKEHESKTCVNSERVNAAFLIRFGDFLFSRANRLLKNLETFPTIAASGKTGDDDARQ